MENEWQHRDEEDIELDVLLEAIYQRYGYDFRKYAKAHIKRRLAYLIGKEKIPSFSHLQYRVLREEEVMQKVIEQLSINVTEMFRDADFFMEFREKVISHLRTCPRIKIWHAGCSTGEEVYSMAILLKEAGIYNRCQIYATDYNEKVIQKAKTGIYELSQMQDYTKGYMQAGGEHAFSDYYLANNGKAMMIQELKENISFFTHNMVSDHIMGEMDVIICRNVFIYFSRSLQNEVATKFNQAIRKEGFICLGNKESLEHTSIVKHYEKVAEEVKIYKKSKRYRK